MPSTWSPDALYEAYRAEEASYAAAATAYEATLKGRLERAGMTDCTVKARSKSAIELYKKYTERLRQMKDRQKAAGATDAPVARP